MERAVTTGVGHNAGTARRLNDPSCPDVCAPMAGELYVLEAVAVMFRFVAIITPVRMLEDWNWRGATEHPKKAWTLSTSHPVNRSRER
jgi:hypothetical protein